MKFNCRNAAILCPTVGCSAIYCKNCYEQSNAICCLCHEPVDYGDFSDISNAKYAIKHILNKYSMNVIIEKHYLILYFNQKLFRRSECLR